MSPSGGWARQISDLVAYVAVPLTAVLTPAAISRRLIRRVTRWEWLLADAS